MRQDGLEDELRQSREKLERLVKKSLVRLTKFLICVFCMLHAHTFIRKEAHR